MTTRQGDPRVAALAREDARTDKQERDEAGELASAIAAGVTLADIVDKVLADGTVVQTLKASGRWIDETYREPGLTIAVVVNDDQTAIVRRFYAVEGYEIDRIVKQVERNAANRLKHQSAEATFVKILAAAKIVPLIHAAGERREWGERRIYSITELEGLLESCSGRLKSLRNGAAALVEAPDPAAVTAAVVEAEQLLDGMERSALRRLGIKHRADCRTAVFVLNELGALGLKYAKDGKRPSADTGKGKAERMGPAGVWLP